jgi:hypothetical protein
VNDDYLWSGQGVPDPEVQRLERLLGTLRHVPAPSFEPRAGSGGGHRRLSPRRSSHVVQLAIAATLIAAVGAGWLVALTVKPGPGWQVSSLEGAPTVADNRLDANGWLEVGDWLETGDNARARITAGTVGQVDVDQRSRIRLSSARTGNYRLSLVRGTMHAIIWASPGQFSVDTPSSTAVDLGCAYSLHVADDGSGNLEVTSGWVGFVWHGKESFIPAGAQCATRPRVGPGTPHYPSASPAFQAALTTFDFEPVTTIERERALDTVLGEAQATDAVTLWHLFQRVGPADRDRIFDRLAAFVPPPAGVTREGVRAGQRAMLDLWWDEFGLGSMQLWRQWQQDWHDH